MAIERLLEKIDLSNVSDIFLSGKQVPHLRIKSEILPYQDVFIKEEDITAFRQKVLSPEAENLYQKTHSADAAFQISREKRFRLNFYQTAGGNCIAIRPIRRADDLDFKLLVCTVAYGTTLVKH